MLTLNSQYPYVIAGESSRFAQPILLLFYMHFHIVIWYSNSVLNARVARNTGHAIPSTDTFISLTNPGQRETDEHTKFVEYIDIFMGATNSLKSNLTAALSIATIFQKCNSFAHRMNFGFGHDLSSAFIQFGIFVGHSVSTACGMHPIFSTRNKYAFSHKHDKYGSYFVCGSVCE